MTSTRGDRRTRAAPVRPGAGVRSRWRRRRRFESATGHVVGASLTLLAPALAVCAVVEVATGGPGAVELFGSGAISLAVGAGLWTSAKAPARVPTASAFAAVGWTWIGMSVFGALPFWWSGMIPSPLNALFESVSGFTGTGATVLVPIEGNGRGLLLWRQTTQWYGGMGVIVLVIAVLPLLGVGGYELLRAESPGPTSDRLAPRVSDTARRLWVVYLGFTILMVAALMAVGMSLYDAVSHAMTTVSTGGFSPYDASIAAFDSLAVEIVLIISMTAGAISFALWWQVARGIGLRALGQSSELRVFLGLLVAATVAVAAVLIVNGDGAGSALRSAAFTMSSVVSTTGYATADFSLWPSAGQLIVLALMVPGGMAGSTSGAVKLFRIQVMAAHARRELRHIWHPRAVLPVKLGGFVVPEGIVGRIVGFFVLYVGFAIIGTVALAALGADLVTASSSITSAIGAFGPALGEAGPVSNYLVVDAPSRALLIVYMLLGRLELFTLLLMLVAPARSLRYRGRR